MKGGKQQRSIMKKTISIIAVVTVGLPAAILAADKTPGLVERVGDTATDTASAVGDTVGKAAKTGINAVKSGLGWTVDTVEDGTKTVGDVMKGAGKASLRTADTAFHTVGMDTELSDEGPYTVFAPDDDAFDKLPKERRENLMKAENKEELRKLLDHHVAEGDLTPDQAAEVKASTRAGDTVVFKENNRLQIGDKEVKVKERIKARNGTLYVIDSVVGA